MKIRSLLLGSIAAAGLATTGYAADLGVVTSLDVCDELGLSGLTISSDDNCLVITGSVSVEYSLGNYHDADSARDLDVLANEGRDFIRFQPHTPTGTFRVNAPDLILDSSLDIDAWLKFVATADSDFGPATATIKLLTEDLSSDTDKAAGLDEGWVGIGDTTQLMAGRKGSIFNDGDDAPLNYLGLFNSENVDVGVGFSTGGTVAVPVNNFPTTGGNVIQLVSNLGNGISVGGGLENLASSNGTPASVTAVGVINYAGEGVTAHGSGAINNGGLWKIHAGFKGTWDPITIVGAVAANNGYWNVLGSAAATFDIFTLAVAGEATSAGEFGVGGSVSAKVTEGVTINLGSRLFAGFDLGFQSEAGISAAVTETITATAAVGYVASSAAGGTIYGKAGLAWAPGGGFTSSVEGYVNSLGAYKGTFKAAKTIK